MPTDELVSICIPSYNHGRFLPAAIDSALSQTYRPIEVVIVDDGSTDDSWDIARSYVTKYPSLVRVYCHPGRQNRGISASVNLAFQESYGRYLSGLPSDDILYPDKIERQVSYLRARPEVGWVYGYADLINAEGQPVPGRIGIDLTNNPDPMARMLQVNCVPGPTVIARRVCIEGIGPHDEHLVFSDWDWWVRMLAHFPVAFVDRPLVKYRVHSTNTSVGIPPERTLRYSLEAMLAMRRKAADVGGLLSNPRYHVLMDLETAYLRFALGETAASSSSIEAAFASHPPLADEASQLARWVQTKQSLLSDRQTSGATPGNFVSLFFRSMPRTATSAMLRRCLRDRAVFSLFVDYLIGSRIKKSVRQLKARVSRTKP